MLGQTGPLLVQPKQVGTRKAAAQAQAPRAIDAPVNLDSLAGQTTDNLTKAGPQKGTIL